jgi:hypothetical protein
MPHHVPENNLINGTRDIVFHVVLPHPARPAGFVEVWPGPGSTARHENERMAG